MLKANSTPPCSLHLCVRAGWWPQVPGSQPWVPCPEPLHSLDPSEAHALPSPLALFPPRPFGLGVFPVGANPVFGCVLSLQVMVWYLAPKVDTSLLALFRKYWDFVCDR